MSRRLKPYARITDIPVIDAHMHVFPDKLYVAIKQWFENHAWNFQEDGTAETFISRQLDRGARGLVLLPYAHKPGAADSLNDFIADLTGRFPGTIGMAAVHPLDPDPGRILDRAFNDLGLVGVKLHCHVMKVAPDDPILTPIYECVLEHDKVMVMHAGREPAIPAYGVDVRKISGAERVEAVLNRYPELKLVVPHLGYDQTPRFAGLMNEFPNLYLDTAMLIADYLPCRPNVDLIAEHADRILYGTDYPHIPYPWDVELRKLLALNLGFETNRKILHDNAARLFNFESRKEPKSDDE